MRNLKRVLSMALASVMVLGLTVVGASAANFNDQAEIENTTAAAVMNAIGIIEGNEKGDFMPDQVLTREQAAKIITYMVMGPENAEKLGTSGTQFSDVAADRWSAPYIAYCANMGILAGDGTGKFNPEGELTGHAFAKMLLVALGYDATIQNYVGNSWSINVATDAVNAGIYVDGTVMSNPMTRDEAAQMAFQTLSADMVKYSNKGTTITVGGVEIVQGASSPEKVAATGKGYDDKEDGVQQFCEKYFKDLKKVTTGETDDMGRPAVTWSYDDEDVATVTDSADKTLVVDDAYASYTKALQELLDNDKATIGEFSLNNDGSTAASTTTKVGDVMYVYETDTKNEYDVVVAQYSFGIIDEIDTKVKSSDEKDGVKAYVTVVDANGTKKLTDVKDTDFAGFAYKEGDAIAYVAKDKKVIDSYALESVEGKITAYKADEYVRVDGTKYELSDMLSDEAGGNYDFDETYTLYTDANGYVLGIKGEAGTVSLDEVYYVAKIYTESTTSYGKTTYNSYAQAVAMDGTVKEILIEKDDSDKYQGGQVTEGKLYTFEENEDDSKVFDGTEYTTDKNYTVFDVKKDSNQKVAVTSSTTRLNSSDDSKRAYIEKNTQFVLVEGSADKLETKTYTGSARVTVDKAIAITDKDDTAVYVILVATKNAGTVTEEDALIYIASTGAKVADGYEAEAYDMNGNAIENVVVKNSVSAGLYTFAINDDGVYVDLNKVNSTSIKDDEGYAIDATITVAKEKRGTVDFTSGAKYEDYDAAKATIIDLRSDDDMNADKYDREITNLGDLESAVAAGEVKADLYVNDSIQVIFVTSCVNAD